MTTAAKRLIERQFRKATTTRGRVDTQRLCELVVLAYEEHDLARRRTEQSAGVMAAEIEEANAALERSVEQLRNQNIRFSLALDNMANGLVLLDTNGNVVVFNRRECEILALPDDIFCENLSYEAFLRASPRLDEAAILVRLELATTRVTTEAEQILSDGRHVRIAIKPTADGGFLVSSEDVTERNVSSARIAFLAYHDTLTELPNRRKFAECLDRAVSRGRYAVLCIDLDGFKLVNDTFGHATGDALLREVAARLKRQIRPGDMLARLGGDEFAIILSSDASEADGLAARITHAISSPFDLDGTILHIGASVGVAIAPDDADTAPAVMRCADVALYRAKQAGRGCCVRFTTAMNVSPQARDTLKEDLSVALLQSQFELYYQPRVYAQSGKIASFEALIRWHHPVRGIVMPGEFIPLAEQSGAIVEIGQWVLRQACQEALRWPEDIGIAVNVSTIQIRNGSLFDQVMSALNETGLEAKRLEIEITETVLLSESAATLDVMRRVQAIGVQVAMDDFGTGYSSLNYLLNFPFDRIKIDRGFVSGLGRDAKTLAIIRAVIGLCHSLEIAVTAEGVETQVQRDILLSERCGELQGNLFGLPVPVADAFQIFGQIVTPFVVAAQQSHRVGDCCPSLAITNQESAHTPTTDRRRPGRLADVGGSLVSLLRTEADADTFVSPLKHVSIV